MKFFEHKTLETLQYIDVDKIMKNIDEGKKDFNIQKLIDLLALLQKDMLVSHSPLLEVGVCLESRKNNDNMYLTLFTKIPIMPTLFKDIKKISIEISFKNFNSNSIDDIFQNAVTRVYGFEKEKNQCNYYCRNMVNFLRRIDNFLDFKEILVNKFIENAIYIERSQYLHENFTIEQNLESIEIKVVYKGNNKLTVTPFSIKIKGSVSITRIEFAIYNMRIELDAKEYENTSDEVIFNIISNFLSIKNIEVNSIRELKSQLSILQMIHD